MSIFELTSRLRRQFPRHADVLALCDEAERLTRLKSFERPGPRRDRAEYMREWRRRNGKNNQTQAPQE